MLKVYYLKLSEFEDYPEDFFYSLVSAETQKTVLSIRSEKVRRTKLTGEMMVMEIAGKMTGKRQPELHFIRTPQGKPYLSDLHPPLYFNISHSGDYVIAGFSDHEIGVDIEKKTACRLRIARRFFHPGETAILEQLDDLRCKEEFFRYWAAKESFLKYTGSGLSAPLSGFRVFLDAPPFYIEANGNKHTVHLQECLLDPAYACFICSAFHQKAEIFPFTPAAYTK